MVANEGEAAATGSDPARLARRPRQGLVVTRGAAGALAILRDGVRIEVPALAIEPVDTTGAGDTFVGVLAAALDLGSPLEAALHRASAAAGLAGLAPRRSDSHARRHGDCRGRQSTTPLRSAVRGLSQLRNTS